MTRRLKFPGRAAPKMPPLPRKPEEIRRADATFQDNRLQREDRRRAPRSEFPGPLDGHFLRAVCSSPSYRGTNLIRMDALAKTEEPFVAYKYDAGLKGFSTDMMPRVIWRDTG